jgi:hypothetical protein
VGPGRRSGKHREQRDEAGADRARVRCDTSVVRAQERRVERAALWIREPRHGQSFDGREQIAECGKREPCLGRHRTAREHVVAPVRRRGDAVPPDDGLADAGLALEHQRREAVSGGGKRRRDLRQLALSSEDRGLHEART